MRNAWTSPLNLARLTFAVVLWGLALLQGVPAHASCTPYPARIISLWKADNNADDSLGSNHGTLYNDAGFGVGKFGLAFALDGIDDTVLVNASSSLNVGAATGMTIELWINPADLLDRPIIEWNDDTEYGTHLWQYGGPGRFFSNMVDTSGVSHIIK
jgi:hypothetical protein